MSKARDLADLIDTVDVNANNYIHPTDAGNKHIPTGGTVGQILENSASGTVVWTDVASAGGGFITTKYMTAGSHTWTAPSDCTVVIQAVGGGGEGGSMNKDDTSGLIGIASGGSGGGYTRKKVTLTSGDVLTITVGAGGASTYYSSDAGTNTVASNTGGTTTVTGPNSISLNANGGSGGSGVRGNTVTAYTYATQPTGGTASGGDVNLTGIAGANVSSFTPTGTGRGYLGGAGSFTSGFDNSVANTTLFEKLNESNTNVYDEPDYTLGGQPLFISLENPKPNSAFIVSTTSSSINVNKGFTGLYGTGGSAVLSLGVIGSTGARRNVTHTGGDGFVLVTVTDIEL